MRESAHGTVSSLIRAFCLRIDEEGVADLLLDENAVAQARGVSAGSKGGMSSSCGIASTDVGVRDVVGFEMLFGATWPARHSGNGRHSGSGVLCQKSF